VTANLANVVTTDLYSVSSAVKVTGADGQGVLLGGLNSSGNPENVYEGGAIPVRGSVGMDVPISGTVTANSSNGELTTRFGSITTANTAFSTTAVTNTSRKYLMIQNIASTVITAGIGFTPTTTQGIQIVSGATITFDGNYIPTGAVRILSSVTASNFTVLEA
jgi:hypothetical protein